MHMYMHLYVFINYQQDNCSIFTRWYMTLFRNFALSISRPKLYVENIFLFVFNHWKLKACFDSQYLEYSLFRTFWYFEQMPWSLGIYYSSKTNNYSASRIFLTFCYLKLISKPFQKFLLFSLRYKGTIHIFFTSKSEIEILVILHTHTRIKWFSAVFQYNSCSPGKHQFAGSLNNHPICY